MYALCKAFLVRSAALPTLIVNVYSVLNEIPI
jgi:hypothetical protein